MSQMIMFLYIFFPVDGTFVPISESADTAGLQYSLTATPAQGALLIPEQIIVHTLPLAQVSIS